MPRGYAEYKRRYTNQRETYHQRRTLYEIGKRVAELNAGLQHIFRRDNETGGIERINRSRLNREVGFFPKTMAVNKNLCPYASPAAIVWEELENGAVFFGEKAIYWLETVCAARAAA